MPMVRISDDDFEKLSTFAKSTHRSKTGAISYLLESISEEILN